MLDLSPTADERACLADVAAGRRPADLLVTGGRVVDVEAETVHDGWSVAVAGQRVAAVGPDLAGCRGAATEVFDAAGGLVAPGLIEPHSHLGRLFIRETARLQAAAGVTTTILETTEVGYIGGVDAVRAMLDEGRRAPGRLLWTLSPTIGLDAEHDAELGPVERWIPLLDDERVIGVGEAFWADLLRGHARALGLYAAARERGLAIEGHGAGAREPALARLAELGVGSDHEPITAAEVEARLRLGMYVYLRHGVTRQDLPALAGIWRDGRPPDRVAFCTDGVAPSDLVTGRSLNTVVADAARTGLPLATAIRMSTLVPASRFGLAPWLGALRPGALADVVVFPDESLAAPTLVLCSGRRPPPAEPAEFPGLRWSPPALALDEPLLARPAPGRYRAMEIRPEAPMVTREVEVDARDALPVAVIDRVHGRRAFRGLALGLGIQGGAVASSVVAESVAILAAGDSPADMRLACERVAALGGGVAVFAGGRELASWSAPIAGLLSDAEARAVADEVDAVNAALHRLGCRLPDPLTSLDFLTSPAIPHLRISPDGYHRLRDGARLPLALDS